jgi:hypothetical protein
LVVGNGFEVGNSSSNILLAFKNLRIGVFSSISNFGFLRDCFSVSLALLCLGIGCGVGVGNFLGGGTFCMVLILVGNSSLPMIGPRFGNLGWYWDGVGNWLWFGIDGGVGTGARLGILHKFSWFSLGFHFLLEICWPKSSTSMTLNCPFWFEKFFPSFCLYPTASDFLEKFDLWWGVVGRVVG